jgi:hypothetical protein
LLAHWQGKRKPTTARSEESLALFREMKDKLGISLALRWYGQIKLEGGSRITALAIFEESLALAREIGNMRLVSDGLNNIAWIAYLQGDILKAKELY